MGLEDLSHLSGSGSRTASVQSADDSLRSTVRRGRVVGAPVSAADGMVVALEGFSVHWPFDVLPGHWTPRSPLPAVGTVCVVIFDPLGDPWVQHAA